MAERLPEFSPIRRRGQVSCDWRVCLPSRLQNTIKFLCFFLSLTHIPHIPTAMWTTLPIDILAHVFVYVDPDWVRSLSKSCKIHRRLLQMFYAQRAGTIVRHEWNHRLGKRARDSLSIDMRISTTPRAVASLVHRRCARCHERFLGKIHHFGILIHEQCVKDLLVNIYYLRRDFRLDPATIDALPTYKCEGWHGTYIRVWKNGFRGIVPYEWTAHCLVHKQAASQKHKWNNRRHPYLD